MVVTKNTSQKGPLSGWDKWPEWVGQSGDWMGFVPSSYNLKIGTVCGFLYIFVKLVKFRLFFPHPHSMTLY